MAYLTHSEFGANTEGLDVATAFGPLIKDRTILITGVNKSGIGYTTAEAFASQHPAHLILAGRSVNKVQECIDALRLEHPNVDYRNLKLDLASQKSIRSAASEVLDWSEIPSIDIVINNAGVLGVPEHTLTEDGIELQLATNHVGHFLFNNLIMAKIIKSAKSSAEGRGSTRIVNISSLGTYVSPFRFTDPNWSQPSTSLPENERPNLDMIRGAGLAATEDMTYIPMAAYGQSKTANVLFSVGLNQKLFEKFGIYSVALHPGEIRTELARHLDKEWYEGTAQKYHQYKSATQGASTTLVAALDPKLTSSLEEGKEILLKDCQLAKAPAYASDGKNARKLWELSEELVGEKFQW